MHDAPLPWIVILGADGAGKSSVIDALAELGDSEGIQVVSYHWRPGVLRGRTLHKGGAVVDPHSKPVRGTLPSLAKLLFLVLDWWLGYLLQIRRHRRLGRLVVFDRSFSDILIDPLRYRYGGAARLAEFAERLVPRPDLFFLLDAPVKVLHARKQEVALEETERQRFAYLERVARLANGHVLDATRPVETSSALILERVRGSTR